MPEELKLKPWEQGHVTRIKNEIIKNWTEKMDNLYEDFKKNIEGKINEVSSKIKEINDFYSDLVNWNEENDSIKAEIQWILGDANWKLKDIQEKYSTLIDWDNWIIEHNEIAKNKKEEIEWLLDEVSPLINEFNEYYDKVFGKEDEEWNRKWWLKDEIEKREQEYTALKNKIESLLPWATSTWLAYAYEKHKKTFMRQKRLWTIIFVLALGWMILSYLLYNPGVEIQERWWWIIKFLIRAPITIPCVWLASFSWKQQNKYQRLEQEYAYKESLCRSFEWYRKEIEKINDSESANQLQIDLFNVIIQMSSYNPSITLESKSNNEKSPYWTALDKMPKLAESVGKGIVKTISQK